MRAGSVMLLALACAQALAAEPSVPDTRSISERPEILYMTVVRNQIALDGVTRFEVHDKQVMGRAQDLRAIGILLDHDIADEQLVDVSTIDGVVVEVNRSAQVLNVELPVGLLNVPVQQLNNSQQQAPLSDMARGVVLDYDVLGQHHFNDWNATMWGQVRTLGRGGQFSHSFQGTAQDEMAFDGVRLDTNWVWRDPNAMTFWSVGDTVSGTLDWGRAMRMGGVQFGRDFSLQPYRSTSPALTLSSSAALPSTVDVIIDGVRTERREVLPGRFDLDVPIPVIGAGMAQVVVTDINGVEQVVQVPLYGTAQLLDGGLTDGTVEVGYLRQDYGLRSAAYDNELTASGHWRRGMTDDWTVEAQANMRDGSGMAGVGSIVRLPHQWGVVYLAAAGSFGAPSALLDERFGDPFPKHNRYQYAWGWQRQGQVVSASLASSRWGRGFFDAVSLAEGGILPEASDQAWIGLSTRAGQWNVGYVHQVLPSWRDIERREQSLATLAWSGRWKSITASVNVSHDLDLDVTRGYLSVAIPLEERKRVQISRQQSNQVGHEVSDRTGIAISSPLPGDEPGWGWRAAAAVSDEGSLQQAWAQVDRQAVNSLWSGGWNRQGSLDQLWAEGRGSLSWIGGLGPRMIRQTDEAFAVVDAGMPDVPVRLENRLVGRTGEDGKIVLDRLRPWQANRISVDTQDLPLDVVMAGPDTVQAVPAQGQGAVVAFALLRQTSLSGTVTRAGGAFVPGTPIELLDEAGGVVAKGVVGNGGAFWLDAAAHTPHALRVVDETGTCVASLPKTLPERNKAGVVRLGALSCEEKRP